MSFSSIRPANAVLPDPLDPLSIILNGVTNLSFSLKIAFVVSGIFEKKHFFTLRLEDLFLN